MRPQKKVFFCISLLLFLHIGILYLNPTNSIRKGVLKLSQPELTTRTPFYHKTTIVSELSPVQKPLVLFGGLAAIILFVAIINAADITQGILFIIGLALGVTLLHARFGFTSAFRRLMSVGNVQGLQAHMLMLAVASTLFAVILSTGFSFTGVTPAGYVSPVGVSVIFGAFLFGVGMQRIFFYDFDFDCFYCRIITRCLPLHVLDGRYAFTSPDLTR
jgi:hypothetical protein